MAEYAGQAIEGLKVAARRCSEDEALVDHQLDVVLGPVQADGAVDAIDVAVGDLDVALGDLDGRVGGREELERLHELRVDVTAGLREGLHALQLDRCDRVVHEERAERERETEAGEEGREQGGTGHAVSRLQGAFEVQAWNTSDARHNVPPQRSRVTHSLSQRPPRGESQATHVSRRLKVELR